MPNTVPGIWRYFFKILLHEQESHFMNKIPLLLSRTLHVFIKLLVLFLKPEDELFTDAAI